MTSGAAALNGRSRGRRRSAGKRGEAAGAWDEIRSAARRMRCIGLREAVHPQLDAKARCLPIHSVDGDERTSKRRTNATGAFAELAAGAPAEELAGQGLLKLLGKMRPSTSWPNDCHAGHCLYPSQSQYQPVREGT